MGQNGVGREGRARPYWQTQVLQEPKQEGRASLEIPGRLLGLRAHPMWNTWCTLRHAVGANYRQLIAGSSRERGPTA